ncbi:hypothetical protein [Novosphingobium sp.]|uniref:hypothetical protein n=1 Tax=Novosphingobium sp. TaxID=1874826 RepID=UPI0035B24E7C
MVHKLPDDGKEQAERLARYFCRADDGWLVTLHQHGGCDGLTCTANVFASCFELQPPGKPAAQVRMCRSLCKQQTNME